MVVPLIAEPPSSAEVAWLHAVDLDAEPHVEVRAWPPVGAELNMIERYVLARVAVHTCNHRERVPYIAPNAHQFAVALALAAPEVQLLIASTTVYEAFQEVQFWLSWLGEQALRRWYPIMPLEDAMDKEIEFDKLRALMRNEWETWDEAGPAPKARPTKAAKATKATKVTKATLSAGQPHAPMRPQYLRLVRPGAK